MSPPIDVVAGRYRLLSLLGQGGMGSVWRGEHISLMSPVAIKLLDPRLAQKESVRGRFLREARAAAALQSQHVVQILDHGVEGDIPFIVMELLRGESLGARLQRKPPLAAREVAQIFVEMGRAMARAHKAGVIHRDLKPDNVFLCEIDEESLRGGGPAKHYVVKVVDFGIAKLTDDGTFSDDVSTDTGSMIGTPHYMSPEQARSVKAIDARADLWSMGIIAFECLTGARPFRAEALGDLIFRICTEVPPAPSTVAPVPPGFDAWFAKATEKKPDDRFQTVSDLVRALEEVLTPGHQVFEMPSGATPSPTEPRASQAELDATVPDASPRATERTPQDIVTKTADPSSASVAPASAQPTRRVAVGIALTCVAVAAAFGLMRAGASASAPSVDLEGPPASGPAAATGIPEASTGAARTPVSEPPSPSSASASPTPTVSPAPSSAPTAQVAASTAAASPKTPTARGAAAASGAPGAKGNGRPGCEEPFTIDKAGDLVPKPECF